MNATRTPDEILTVFDQAQAELDWADKYEHRERSYDLRALLWEVLNDVVDVARMTADQQDNEDALAGAVNVTESITDFLANNYGDDQ
jgi:Rad3-related DNA helicase